MWTRVNGELRVVNASGDLVPGKMIAPKSFGVFWESITGKWVRKIDATRDGVELTGAYREMETRPQYTVVPVNLTGDMK